MGGLWVCLDRERGRKLEGASEGTLLLVGAQMDEQASSSCASDWSTVLPFSVLEIREVFENRFLILYF